MEVLIAQQNTKLAFSLAAEVARAGGQVSGIVACLEEALAIINSPRGPDLLLLDAKFTSLADSRTIARSQELRGCFCIFMAGAPTDVPDDLRRKWPVLRGPDVRDDMRLLLQTAHYFGRLSDAVH